MQICRNKISQIVLINLIAFWIFSIADISMAQEVIRIPDDVPGPPYLLDQAGETYILTQDISAPGTAITIATPGITLDLNGKTISYNELGLDNTRGITASVVTGNLTRLINGKIIQDKQGKKSHAVYLNLGNIEVSHLNITISEGDNYDTDAILVDWGSRANIHDNVIYHYGRAVTDRSQGAGVIEILRTKGGNNIYNNKIIGGPQFGIRVTAYDATSDTLYGPTAIYNNDIRLNSTVVNAYSIAVLGMSDSLIYTNILIPESGRGILLEGSNNVSVYSNYLDVKERPDPEGWQYVFGIRVRYGASDNKIYDNTVIARSVPGFKGATAIKLSDDALRNEFYNNNVSAFTYSIVSGQEARAVHIEALPTGSGNIFHNNILTSNNQNIYLFGWPQDKANDILFRSETLVKADNPINYLAIYGYIGAQNNTFLDTRFGGGASFNNVSLWNGTNSIIVKWYLDVLVKDINNNPISDATVSASSSQQTVSANTDASGRARLILTQYKNINGAKTFYTPHTLTISKTDYETASEEVTMDASKSSTVTLTAIGVNNPPFASDLSRVKAYPNPYRGDKHSQVIFDNLTADVKIKIYTLGGEVVREIKEQEGDKAYWDMKNKQGETVSSGIYVYYITNPKGEEKKGEIAIIK